MNAPAIDAEVLFDRLRPDALFGEDWVVVYDLPRAALARKTIAPDVSLLRAQYTIDLTLADTLQAIRPEIFLDPRRPSYDKGVLECGLEQVLAPGDCITLMRPQISTQSMHINIGAAPIVGAVPVAAHGTENSLRQRWIVRRKFPTPDEAAFVCAPICPQTGALLEQQQKINQATNQAISCAVGAHPDDPEGTTLVTEVRLLRGVADWCMEHMAGFYLQKNHWVPGYKASPVYEEVNNGSASYVVVSLSKLTRGPPLLPPGGSDSAWASVESEGVSFDAEWQEVDALSNCSWYLREFLHRIGLKVNVYSSLDGQNLVYYQAALWRSEWNRVRAALDGGPWRAHGAAYRKRHGGKHAPRLAICAEPRFRDNAIIVPSHVVSEVDKALRYEAEGQSEGHLVPVVGTFVHYSAPPGLTRGRVVSNPEPGAAA